MISFILSCVLFASSSTGPLVDSLHQQKIITITMDSLEVTPMPALSEFAIGDTPVDVDFEKVLFDAETQNLTIRGFVRDHQYAMELPGARVILGSLNSMGTEHYFSPRSSILTDHRGRFTLTTKVLKSDILVIVWLGYLEKVYSFKKILEEYSK